MKKVNPLKYITVILFLGVLIEFTSCEKESSIIGFDLVSPDEKFEFFCDTLNLEMYTIGAEKTKVEYKNVSAVGSYVDPIFGFTEASAAFQVHLSSSNPDFQKIDKFNSLVLHLKIHSIYGDSLSIQTLNVNRIEKDISKDTADVYSDYKLNPGDYSLLKTVNLSYNEIDTAKMIQIELPEELGRSFISEANKDHFTTTEKFKNFFKGFYLTTDAASSNGCIYLFETLGKSSKLVLNYDDSLSYSFSFNSSSSIVLKSLDHDYTSASQELTAAINDTLNTKEYSYIQGLAGVKSMIKIPNLKNIIGAENISINRAKLHLNVADNIDEDKYPSPVGLYIYTRNNNGEFEYIRDVYMNNNFDGSYKNHTYTFNISTFMLSTLSGNSEISVYVAPVYSSNQIFPQRTVLFADPDSEKGPKLELYYSKY
jgi:hypothetical protein